MLTIVRAFFFYLFILPLFYYSNNSTKKNLFFVRKLMLKKKSFQLVYYSNTIQPFFMQLFVGEIFDILTTASDTVQIYWYQNFDSKKKNLTIKIFCIKNLKVTVYKLKKLAYFIDISMLYSYLTLNTFKLIWVVFLFFEIWL